MALVTVVSGRFSSTLTPPSGSPLDLGIMKSPGYKIGFQPAWKNVAPTDAYAEQVIEQIWRGWSLVYVDCTSEEYKAGPLRAVNPVKTYAPTGATAFDAGTVGVRATDLAGSLIFTSTTGTPAVATPATATFSLAIAREGYDFNFVLDSDVREVPMSFRILPVTDGGSPVAARYWAAT